MNWNQLQYVVTVAEEKNITKAAKKLFISQPSLSLSIHSLEKETGVALFQRSHGEMSLTYAGTLFYQWAVSTLHSQNQLTLKLNDISSKKRNLIRMGISPHRSHIILPDILEKFYMDYPNCEIHLVEKPTYILKELLESSKIDFMIDIPHPDTINYQSDLLTDEKILLAVPASFSVQEPFCKLEKRPVSLSQTSNHPYIMLSSEQILGSISRKMCESASFYPNIRMICENVETALSLVSSQIGITFVPEIIAEENRYHSKVVFYPIQLFHDTRQLSLIYPKNQYQSLQLSHLLSLLRETVPKLYQK